MFSNSVHNNMVVNILSYHQILNVIIYFQSLESTVPRYGLSRHLDIDGLTKFSDPVQKEVVNIKMKYEHEISRLQDHVSYLSRLLSQHASACNGDVCNLEFKIGNVSTMYRNLQFQLSSEQRDLI